MIRIDYYKLSGRTGSAPAGKYAAAEARQEGSPPEEGEFQLFPSGRTVWLKERSPSGESDRCTLRVRGLSGGDLKEGGLLIPACYGAAEEKKALVIWKGNPPGNRELTVSLRDLPDHPLPGRFRGGKGGRVSRLAGAYPFLQIPGQIYRCEWAGGSAECVLLMAGPFSDDEAKQMVKRAGRFGNFPGPESIYSMNLRVRGYVTLPEALRGKEYEGALLKGRWLLMSRHWEKWTGLILKRAGSEGGVRESALTELLGCPEALVRRLSADLTEQGRLFRREGFLLNASDEPERYLSPMTRAFYEELRQAGTEGLSLKEALSRGRSDLPDILRRRGLARCLETLLFSREAYETLCSQVRELFPSGRPFDLSDLTGRGDLSRGRLLQILDAMEEDGLIRSLPDKRREPV